MDSLYSVSSEAQDDLFEIWACIAADSVSRANRIEDEFHELFASFDRVPGQRNTRRDLTHRPVLFLPLYSFLVVYEPGSQPVRIVAVLRGKRDVRRILKARP